LYKKTLFDGILYPKGKLYEDSHTSYKLLYRARKIVFTTTPLYYYYENPESITTDRFSERTFDVLEAGRCATLFFENEQRYDAVNVLKTFLLAREIYCWWGVKYVLKENERAKEMLKTFRMEYRNACTLKDFSFKWKMIFLVFSVCPSLYALYKKVSPVYIGNQ